MIKKIPSAILFCFAILIVACNQKPQVQGSDSVEVTKVDTLVSTDSSHIVKTADSADEKIIFKATGNEPFWGLSIDAREIKFTSLVEGFEKLNAPYAEPIRAMDANVKMYRSQSEDGEIKVQVFQGQCIDDMSGQKKNYKVSIEIKRTTDKDFKTFTGCGDYITDNRLYDIWVLREIAGKPAQQSLYGKEIPRIEINTTEKTFMAFTGSKDIQGKILIEGITIRFTTYKEPPGLNAAEKDFLEKLRTANAFTIANLHLSLSNSSGTLLKFKKVD